MHKRFVSIWFPYLATDWLAVKRPHLRSIPFVVKATVRNRMVITAANALANAQGIHTNMVLPDAKALCPALYVIDDEPKAISNLPIKIAEWCIRFTPIAAADSPDAVLIDATGCTHLWGSEENYLNDILKRLNQKGYSVRVAMADTIGCAWAMARFGDQSIVESEKQTEALLHLPVMALRLDEETVVLLQKLGLRQIKNLLSIPHTSLRRRFGKTLIQRLRQAVSSEEENLLPVHPIEAYAERLPCMELIKTKEGIEIALQYLLTKLCARLCKEGKGLRTAFFGAYRIDGGISCIEISINQPSQNAERMFELFSIKISTIEPKEGIELFVLHSTKVEDAVVKQEALWQTNGVALNTEVLDLMDRFANKFGAQTIQRFLPTEHYWPERSFKKSVDLHEQPNTEWRLERPRPLQLLAPPELINVTAPIPDYPPLNFRYKEILHTVTKADGPERIEQEWWIQDGEHRDYYSVEDEEGKRYWLFRSGHYNETKSPKWFLHGFFA
ncbi:MAG: DNA polymerase Y family protein [Bacteroidota bacterium]